MLGKVTWDLFWNVPSEVAEEQFLRQLLFRVKKNNINVRQTKIGKSKCSKIATTYEIEYNGKIYFFSTRNNYCEFLASDAVKLKCIDQAPVWCLLI